MSIRRTCSSALYVSEYQTSIGTQSALKFIKKTSTEKHCGLWNKRSMYSNWENYSENFCLGKEFVKILVLFFILFLHK